MTLTSTPTDDIDALLERYLHLLDEHTQLRTALTDLQSRMYQNIARANFSAERGVRYGQDLYDQRMQSSRRLVIAGGDEGPTRFEVEDWVEEESEKAKVEEKGDEAGDAAEEKLAEESESKDGKSGGGEKDESNERKDKDEKDRQKATKPRDPLRWFGILTPMALRQAQSQAIEAVEKIIPRLVTVNTEMADVEIRVRRARKRRAKASAGKEGPKARTDEGMSASFGLPSNGVLA